MHENYSINPELFELIGALLGDGCIKYYKSKKHNHYVIEIYGNLTEDISYLDYLSKILQKISGKKIKPRVKDRNNDAAVVLFCSKEFVEFLIFGLEVPYNNKTYTAKIPQTLLNYDWNYTKNIIRGLVDTDGCLFFGKKGCYRSYSYPMIELKMRSHALIDQVQEILLKQGFKANVRNHPDGCKCLYLSGKHQINLWMREIGLKNPKHSSKYLVWKRLGYCLPNTTLIQRKKILQRRRGSVKL